jgi:hypothetical protein
VTTTAVLTALWALAFAAVNIWFEATGHFSDGQYADYAAGLSVMNWLVTGLKVVGAAVALLSVTDRSRRPRLLAVLLWAAFSTLAIYAVGNVVQALGMVTGVIGGLEDVDAAAVGYLVGFLPAAVGFGVLAVSYSRRHRIPRRLAVISALGGPVLLVLVLVAAPALLVAVGLMPSY